MNSLAEMLKDVEVEWKPLGEVCEIKRGTRITKNELIVSGKYPVVSGGTGYMGYTNSYNRDENTITIAQYGTAGFVKIQKEKFWANDVCFCVYPKKILDNKYLYYFLIDKQNYLYSISNRSAIPYSINKNEILKIKIPIPPLKVQEEIAKTLDKFTECVTELTAELTAELTLRRKQYAYYRDKLLSEEYLRKSQASINIERVSLGEVCEYSRSRIHAKELSSDNYVGVDNLLQNKQGKTNSNYVPQKGILTRFNKGDVLVGNIRPYLRKIWRADVEGGANGDVLIFKVKNEYNHTISSKYLYQILSDESFFDFVIKKSKGAKMPRGDKKQILKYEFLLPSVDTQNNVCEFLDKFDKLTNDIAEGLPAEIALRQKQYEYYREKLLTFKE